MTDIPYVALMGLDWADQKHDICLYDCATQIQERSVIGARPEALPSAQRSCVKLGQCNSGCAMEDNRLLFAWNRNEDR